MTIILSFLQTKGGVGKTTFATNVAYGIKLRGKSVMLIDQDPHSKSAREWNEENGGTILPVIGLDMQTIEKDLAAISKPYDFIVIDGAPQIDKLAGIAVSISDIVLIPVQPSIYDIWAASYLAELVKNSQDIHKGKPKCAMIISRAIKKTKLFDKEVISALKEYELPVFNSYTTQLVAYPTSASEGLTVYHGKTYENAKNEIESIVNEIFERFIC